MDNARTGPSDVWIPSSKARLKTQVLNAIGNNALYKMDIIFPLGIFLTVEWSFRANRGFFFHYQCTVYILKLHNIYKIQYRKIILLPQTKIKANPLKANSFVFWYHKNSRVIVSKFRKYFEKCAKSRKYLYITCWNFGHTIKTSCDFPAYCPLYYRLML